MAVLQIKDGRDLAMEVRGEKGQNGPGSGTGLYGVQLQPVARLVSERQRPQNRAGQGTFQQDAGPDEETEGGIKGTYFAFDTNPADTKLQALFLCAPF